MAKDVLDTRYLVFKPSPADARRAYWQPDAELREAGWLPLRLAKGLSGDALLQAAATEAHAQNQQLAAWQRGERPVVLDGGPVKARVQPGTLAHLIDHYEASEDFAGLSPKTQRGYKQCLKRLRQWAGPEALVSLSEKRWKKFYNQLRTRTPALAKALLVMGKTLWKYGISEEIAPRPNPILEITLHGADPSGLVWPREAVEAFVAVADRLGRHSIGTAVLLNEWIGQRQGDVLRLPRNILRAQGLVLRQSKTAAGVVLPIAMVPHLKARIEQELERTKDLEPMPTRLLIAEVTGEPFKEDYFRHEFAEIRRVLAEGDERLGIKPRPRFVVDYVPAGAEPDEEGRYTVKTGDLQFMHLRHTAITRMADQGVDTKNMHTITGHSLASIDSILKRYLVRTRTQAIAAFSQRMAGEGIVATATPKQGEKA